MLALEAIFGSRTRARLLTVFGTHPAEEFFAGQLADRTGLTRATVRYELERLHRLEIVVARQRGQEKLYQANARNPLFPVLKQLVYQTAGLGEALREALVAVPGLQAAFIFGSVAKGTERATSDIDLFILGDPDGDALAKALHDVEGHLGREINVEIQTTHEWEAARRARLSFARSLLESPKIFLVGDESALR